MTGVKICGIKTEEALDAAIEAGADFVGFVFYEKSPRNVTLDTARALVRRARERSTVKTVALLVNPGDGLVSDIVSGVEPDIIQLHGHEGVARVEEIARGSGRAIWKAISVASVADVEAAAAYYAPGVRADLVLFDAKPAADPAALPGGNGLSFDWRILVGAGKRFPFALAGGLTPENVGDAIRLTHPAIVDVSSGVERAPGVKDVVLIRRFIQAAKAAK